METEQDILTGAIKECRNIPLLNRAGRVFAGQDWSGCSAVLFESSDESIGFRFNQGERFLYVFVLANGKDFHMCHDREDGYNWTTDGDLKPGWRWLKDYKGEAR